jgi:hypothetical protein
VTSQLQVFPLAHDATADFVEYVMVKNLLRHELDDV